MLETCYHGKRANISSSVTTQHRGRLTPAGTGFLQAETQHHEIAVTEVMLPMGQSREAYRRRVSMLVWTNVYHVTMVTNLHSM